MSGMAPAAQLAALKQKRVELAARYCDAMKLRDEYADLADRARRDLDSINAQLAGFELAQRMGQDAARRDAGADQDPE